VLTHSKSEHPALVGLDGCWLLTLPSIIHRRYPLAWRMWGGDQGPGFRSAAEEREAPVGSYVRT
jgi:hypothetical protein